MRLASSNRTPSDEQEKEEDVAMEDADVPSSPPTLSRQTVEQAFHLGSDDTEPLLSSSPNLRIEPELPPSRPTAGPKSGNFDSAAEKYRHQQIKQAERIRAQRRATTAVTPKEPVDIRERIAEGLEPRFRTTGTRTGPKRKPTQQSQSLSQKPPRAGAGDDPSATIDPQLLRPGSVSLPTPEASPLLDPVGLALKRNADQASLDEPEPRKFTVRRPGNDLVPPTSRGRANRGQRGQPSPQLQHLERTESDRLRDELKSKPKIPLSAPGEQIAAVAIVHYTMPSLEFGECSQDVKCWKLNNAKALKLPTDLRANIRCLKDASQRLPQYRVDHFAIYERMCGAFFRHIFFKLLATPKWRDRKVTEVHREARRLMYLQFYAMEYQWLKCLRDAGAHYDPVEFDGLHKSMNRLIDDSDNFPQDFRATLTQKAAQVSQEQDSSQGTTLTGPADSLSSVRSKQFSYLWYTLAWYTELPDTSQVPSGGKDRVVENFQDNLRIAAFSFQRKIMHDALRRAERSKATRIARDGFRWFKAENGSQARGDYIIDLFSGTGKWRLRDWIPPAHSSEMERAGGRNVVYHGGRYQWNQVHPRINFAGPVTLPGQSVEVEFGRDDNEIVGGELDASLHAVDGHAMSEKRLADPQTFGQQLSEEYGTDAGRSLQEQIQLHAQQRQQIQHAQAGYAGRQPPHSSRMPSAQTAHRPHPLAQAWIPSEPSTPAAAPAGSQLNIMSPTRAAISQAIISPGPLDRNSEVCGSPSNAMRMQQQFQHFMHNRDYHQLKDIQRYRFMHQVASINGNSPSFSPSRLDPHLQNTASMTPSRTNRTPVHQGNATGSPEYSEQQYEEAIQRTLHFQQLQARGQTQVSHLDLSRQNVLDRQAQEYAPQSHPMRTGLHDSDTGSQQAWKGMPQEKNDQSGLFVPNPLSRLASPVNEQSIAPKAGTGLRKSRRSAAANAEAKTKVLAQAEAGLSDSIIPEQEYDNGDAEGETDTDFSAPMQRYTKGGRRLYAMKGASPRPTEYNASPVAAGRKAEMTEVERWGGKKKKMGRPKKSVTPAAPAPMAVEEPFIDDEPSSPTQYGLTTPGRIQLQQLSQQPFLQQLEQVRDEAKRDR